MPQERSNNNNNQLRLQQMEFADNYGFGSQ